MRWALLLLALAGCTMAPPPPREDPPAAPAVSVGGNVRGLYGRTW